MSAVSKNLLLFGRCHRSNVINALRVCVHRHELDERLVMYFKEKYYFYARDPANIAKEGDYVLIRELGNIKNKTVTHEVEKIVYKAGCMFDPLTGKRITGKGYLDDVVKISDAFGTKLPFGYSEPDDSEEKPKWLNLVY